MADTKIEWTRNMDGSKGKSWNPIRARRRDNGKVGWHCQKKSKGCTNCYAERMNLRVNAKGDGIGNGIPYTVPGLQLVEPYLDEKALLEPLRWKKPTSVFVESMSDLFGSWVQDEWIDKIYAIEALCPQHMFIHVTKRPDRRRAYLSSTIIRQSIAREANVFMRGDRTAANSDALAHVFLWGSLDNAVPGEYVNYLAGIADRCWPLPNVRELVTVCDQDEANDLIPILLQTPAACRGVSIEPILGPINLRPWIGTECVHEDAYVEPDTNATICRQCEESEALDWVICGGESGRGARPMHPDWARSLRDQCQAARVPFFFKQWGEWAPTGYSGGTCKPEQRGQLIPCTVVCSTDRTEIGKTVYDAMPTDGSSQWRVMNRIGKKRAGRLLDGREWNQFPESA